jgi:hypothetical protein
MSFFKKLITGIAIGVAVFVTGGAALSLVGVTAVGGIALTTGTLVAWGAVYGGVMGAAAGLIKPPKMSMTDVQQRLNLTTDPLAYGKWVFGETAGGTDVTYVEKIGETAITHVICAAAHPIDSFGAFYINDELIPLTAGAPTGAWANVFTIVSTLGATGGSALSIAGSTWPATAKGEGMAHYAIRWNFTSENGKKKLKSGIPTRITYVIKGCKVYDPRLDSTNGGTGSQRVADPSTWTWSSNWALIVIHYMLGHKLNGKLLYGMGKPASLIDWPQVIAMANVCDTVLDGKPRYRIGGLFTITNDHNQIIGQLESAIGGKVFKFGAKYSIWCPHDDLTPVGTLTDADIVGAQGVTFIPAGPMEDMYNSARGQYVSPKDLYQPIPYPLVEESAAITVDGKRRVIEMNFSMVQDVEIAQRVARQRIRRTRFTGTITVVCGPRALLIRPFSVINVNFKETNYTNELFRVVAMQYGATGAVMVQLLEEDTSIYDVSLPLGSSLTQLDPSTYDPLAEYAVTGLDAENDSVFLVGGAVVDVVRVFWDTPSAFIDYTEGEYRINDLAEWIPFRAIELSDFIISPAIPEALYEIRVRHVSRSGVPGPYATTIHIAGNGLYDRISAIGIPEPINPKIYCTLLPDRNSADIRITAEYQMVSDIVPDALIVFYSAMETPNSIGILSDTGTKLYVDTANVILSQFELTAASGSSATALKFVPSTVQDIDMSGFWWVSLRDPGNQEYFKVADITTDTISFAPGDVLPFIPLAGHIIDVAEIEYADSRPQEFRLLYVNGEVIRHNGVQFDGAYYIEPIERGAEDTTQANQTGQIGHYYPAYGQLTETIAISVAQFQQQGSTFTFQGRLPVRVPSTIGWLSVSCALAKVVTYEGNEIYIRSPIVPLTTAGPF